MTPDADHDEPNQSALLELVGYRPGEGGATAGLAAVYCLLPLVFKSIAAVLAWQWRSTLEVSR